MRNRFILLSMTVVLTTAGLAHAAATTETEKIDGAYSACIDRSGGVTSSMLDCTGIASGKMDKRLNQTYKALMGKLPKAKQDLLKDAQRKWLEWHSAEQELSYAVDPNEGGTLQTLTASGFAYNMLKQRVKDLEDYLTGLE